MCRPIARAPYADPADISIVVKGHGVNILSFTVGNNLFPLGKIMSLEDYSVKLISYLIFLPVILFIGFITSYEDIKISKIRNKWVLIGLFYPFVIYAAILLISIIFSSKQSLFLNKIAIYLFTGLDKWVINLLVSIFVAYVFWLYGFWGAGDAKLFMTFVALIPIGQYSKIYFSGYFVSFSLLAAIYIPATVALLLKATLYFLKQIFSNDITQYVKIIYLKVRRINITRILNSILGFFTVYLMLYVIQQCLHLKDTGFLLDNNIITLSPFLLFKPLANIIRRNTLFIFFILCVLIAFMGIYRLYSYGNFFGMIFSSFNRAVLVVLFFPFLQWLFSIYSDRVEKKQPFAIWIFIGALITWFY